MCHTKIMELKGKITSLSHLIYIRPKSLFIEIVNNDGKNNVMVKMKSQHIDWKNKLSLRQWIQIDHLKPVSLSTESGNKMHLLETTLDSKLTLIPKEKLLNTIIPNQNVPLINYEGEITDDSLSSTGFYELDNSIILCLTYMKLVSNIPVIWKGDDVVLHNVHRVKAKDKVLIFICGLGNLVNRTEHHENRSLHPQCKNKEDEDFLQDFALETNCGVSVIFTLYQLLKDLKDAFQGILETEDITRKSGGKNRKGVLACLVEHLTTLRTVVPKSRKFSREFLDHDNAGCVPNNKESYWKMDSWPLDANRIESRCNQLDLWKDCRIETDNDAAKSQYWEHTVAVVDSYPDHISIPLLIGVLSFKNGRWEILNRNESIECIASDRDCNQYQNQLVFATKFSVHREVFNFESSQIQRIYVSIDELHPIGLAKSLQPTGLTDDVSLSKDPVQFLVLNKSLPQMMYFSVPAIRHLFGYLVIVSLLRSVPQDGKERPAKRFRMETDSQEGPESCILFFDHLTLNYPILMEGHVYLLHVPRDKLLKNPIYLASLKDIPQYALRSNVYLVPENSMVSPVNYALPRRDSYMHKDVLRAGECLSLDESSQTVSLRGRIVDRMHTEPRFASEKTGQNFTIHCGTWLGVPGNKKVILKIGDDRQSRRGATIDVYFNLREGQIYPFGLCAGSEIELTWLHLHKTQHTGRLYCTSTILTSVRLLKIGHGPGEKKTKIEWTKDVCIGRRFLTQLDSILPHDIFNSVITIRYIHKLAISCKCSGCDSVVTHGVCSYVGCRWNQGTKLDLRAWCTVEDGSAQALMFMSGDCCRRWLKFPPSVWKILEEQVLPHEGEFLYLSSRARDSAASMACKILALYCETSIYLRRPLHVMARKFGNNEVNALTTAYYLKEHPSRRLFCLLVGEMDPTLCAMELAALELTSDENITAGTRLTLNRS